MRSSIGGTSACPSATAPCAECRLSVRLIIVCQVFECSSIDYLSSECHSIDGTFERHSIDGRVYAHRWSERPSVRPIIAWRAS